MREELKYGAGRQGLWGNLYVDSSQCFRFKRRSLGEEKGVERDALSYKDVLLLKTAECSIQGTYLGGGD